MIAVMVMASRMRNHAKAAGIYHAPVAFSRAGNSVGMLLCRKPGDEGVS